VTTMASVLSNVKAAVSPSRVLSIVVDVGHSGRMSHVGRADVGTSVAPGAPATCMYCAGRGRKYMTRRADLCDDAMSGGLSRVAVRRECADCAGPGVVEKLGAGVGAEPIVFLTPVAQVELARPMAASGSDEPAAGLGRGAASWMTPRARS
jgi:hypothetical protein